MVRSLSFCVLLGFSVFSHAFAAPPVPALVEGKRAFQTGKYVEAVKFFYGAALSTNGDDQLKAEIGLSEALRALHLDYSASYFLGRVAARGGGGDYFRTAMELLSEINSQKPLGKSSITPLFTNKINPLEIPPKARGFYFFYRGVEAFDKKDIAEAKAYFSKVTADSVYYQRARYFLGTVATLTNDLDGALAVFKEISESKVPQNVKELAEINMGRVFYEKRKMKSALKYYSMIPRNSDLWLQSLFEGSWAFFRIQKHNNSLGNIHTIHSPFFTTRFFPETYILNSITYLRLCRFNTVRDMMKRFQERYKPTFTDLNAMLKRYQNESAAFYNVISRYKSQGGLREFQAATEIIDSLSRSDVFKETKDVISEIDKERARLSRYAARWESSGINQVINNSFETRRNTAMQSAGSDLFKQAVQLFRYLKDLSDQTRLINLEMLSGRTDQLRAKFADQVEAADATAWGDGMRPLDLEQQIEYWPFEGEYWEDELGSYVYNIDSKCGKR